METACTKFSLYVVFVIQNLIFIRSVNPWWHLLSLTITIVSLLIMWFMRTIVRHLSLNFYSWLYIYSVATEFSLLPWGISEGLYSTIVARICNGSNQTSCYQPFNHRYSASNSNTQDVPHIVCKRQWFRWYLRICLYHGYCAGCHQKCCIRHMKPGNGITTMTGNRLEVQTILRNSRTLTPVHVESHYMIKGCELVFGSLNIHSIANKLDELLEICHEICIDVLFLIETWADSDHKHSSNFKLKVFMASIVCTLSHNSLSICFWWIMELHC